ncbi:MarR family transcriptional regulator [Brucella pseudogrignonensis]|uniref:MarR family winged helix-turn-helix transcriptional regulator n=1 Tax=Brucella pseudogrignonensis TaxID=419475 RepID=UPI001EDBE8B9|nr:MarR family transcriptional regulator [Brucella pseudogrignonensis]UKK94692.1 MarR family transcriptional regulator [Brucella pseudogrignonensis]
MSDDLDKRQHAVNLEDACRAYGALVRQISKTAAMLETVGNASAKPAGQTMARTQVLKRVEDDAASVAAIAAGLGYSRQSVQRLADLLVEDGLCRYSPNPAHRRAKLLEMTAEGRTALAMIQEGENRCARYAAAGIAPAELDQARKILAGICEKLSEL